MTPLSEMQTADDKGLRIHRKQRASSGNWSNSIQRAILENDAKRLGKLLSQRVKLKLTPEDLALALMEAISQGKTECIPPLLAAKADPNCVDEDGKTPLIVCMESKAGGSPAIIRDLLKAGASPNKSTWNTHQTALHLAARKGYQVAVKILLGHGARADKQDANGNTPLSHAAKEGHFTALKMMLESGAVPDTPNKHQETPLLLAAKAGHLDCAEELLECGANPDSRDAQGHTPLMASIKGSHMPMVELLMSYQCDMNSQNIQDGKTILHWAVQMGDIKLIQTILRMGAEPNVRDKDWETPFLTAVVNKRQDVVNLLVKHRCDVKVTDKNFNTGLHLAAREGLVELLPMFFHAGLESNLKTITGQTPLMLAAFGGHEDIVTELLEKGANPDITDRHRASALVYTIMSKVSDKAVTKIVKILIRTGCDLNQAVNLPQFLASNNLYKGDKRLQNIGKRPYQPIEIAFLRGRPLEFLALLKAGCSLKNFPLDVLKQGQDWLSPKRTEFRAVLFMLKNVKTVKKQFPTLGQLCHGDAVRIFRHSACQPYVKSLHIKQTVIDYLNYTDLDDIEVAFTKAISTTRVEHSNQNGYSNTSQSHNSEPFSRASDARSTYTLGSTNRRRTTTNASNQSFRSSESSEDDDVFRRGGIQINRRAANAKPQQRSFSGESNYTPSGTEQWVLNHRLVPGTPHMTSRGLVRPPVRQQPRSGGMNPTPFDENITADIPQSPYIERKLNIAGAQRRLNGPKMHSPRSPPSLESMLYPIPNPDLQNGNFTSLRNRDSLVSNDTGFHSEDIPIRPDSPTERDLQDMKSAMQTWKNFTSPYDSWDNESVDSLGVASISESLDSRDTDASDFSRGSTMNDTLTRRMNGLRNGLQKSFTPTLQRKSRIPIMKTPRGNDKSSISSQFIDVDDIGSGVFRRTKSCRK